ncbi:hypothetical protein J7K50_05430 [bacterium]|nr:hypothetical protein [bacterium]
MSEKELGSNKTRKKAKGGGLPAVTAVAILFILVAVVVVVIVQTNKTEKPDFGKESMSFATGLGGGGSTFPFVGNSDTQVYYRTSDQRARKIPEDERVYFADEKTAKEYGYTRAP